MANTVLFTGMFTLSTTTVIGLYFISGHGTLIVPVGIVGIAIILTYTRWINRWPLLCLVAPGLGFGFVVAVVLPAAAFLILFLTYPLGLGIWLSFTDTRLGRDGSFIGIENFE